jgi:stearoyl-CoA desaturase (delta-9 desaturase)
MDRPRTARTIRKDSPLVIPIFFVTHWIVSVFMQSFFLHRYSAHKMYTVGPRMERFLHFFTWLTQGSSYLLPRAYSVLHREHHAYSDSELDPHSPHQNSNPFQMMWRTKQRYSGISNGSIQPEARFLGGYPEWPFLDTIGQSYWGRLAWVGVYFVIYMVFATAWWQWLLFPFTCIMGPLHGAIVNWCGHMYGYRNYDTGDDSKNTLPVDVLTMGELFQNNHHRNSRAANFARRWFELDPTYQVMRLLDFLGVITLLKPKTTETARPASAERAAL